MPWGLLSTQSVHSGTIVATLEASDCFERLIALPWLRKGLPWHCHGCREGCLRSASFVRLSPLGRHALKRVEFMRIVRELRNMYAVIGSTGRRETSMHSTITSGLT
jgi:hypothetical protein